MDRVPFARLPLLVRVAVGLSLVNAWASFEEFVVDRVGLWQYMPGYKVGAFCVWDFAVTLLVVVSLVRASRVGSRAKT